MTEPSKMNTALRVVYHGRVQGVGFRVKAVQLASPWAIRGYVRNLPNGDVELLASGAADQVAPFLQSIADYWGQNITQTDQALYDGSESFAGFAIRH